MIKNENISTLYINTLSFIFTKYENISSIYIKELIPFLLEKSGYINDKICIAIWELIIIIIKNNKLVENGYICVIMEGIIMTIIRKENLNEELKNEMKKVKNMLCDMNEGWINSVIEKLCKENNKFEILIS